MRVWGLLSWYDEHPSWLAATVVSAAKLCDGIVAVDGAYLLFPDSLRHPTSGPDQADAITRTAAAVGIACTMHVPTTCWWGNEVEKRNALVRLGAALAVHGDWFLIIDGDEVLTHVPPDTRGELGATENDVAEIMMWERHDENVAQAGVRSLDKHPIRRLYRAVPGLTFGPAHHNLSFLRDGARVWLSDADRARPLEPALALYDVKLEHRNHYRPAGRLATKRIYYAQRDQLGIEREEVAP